MEPRLRRQLERMEQRRALVRRDRATAWTWVVLAGITGLAFALRGQLAGSLLLSAAELLVLATIAVLVVRRISARRGGDLRGAARFVESRQPELGTSLQAAIELEPELPDGSYGFLARRLIDEVLHHAHRHPWMRLVPDASLQSARVANAVAACTFAILVVLLASSPFVPALAPRAAGDAQAEVELLVLPGNAEVELGRSVLVSAEFDAARVPAGAELVIESGAGTPRRLAMSRSLDDPIFAVRIASVEEDLAYHVEWSGAVSPSYALTVFAYPELVRADVVLNYPAYTGLGEKRVEDTRRVTAPEGTELTLHCHLNKEVVSARLLDEEAGEIVSLVPNEDHYSATLVLSHSMRLELDLEDAAGRRNDPRSSFVFKASINAPPRILAATTDVRVSALEELVLAADISDDFGLRRYGFGYRLGGAEPVERVLGDDAEPGRVVKVEHTLAFEDLGARPDQLLSYYFWAEDLDTAGETRRTASDLYFGEVRPFEEIFREGQAPAGGGQGGGGGEGMPAGEDLSQVQREIILATWNVIRSELDDEATFLEAAQVVRDAQQDLRERLAERANQARMAGTGGELEAITAAADEDVARALAALDRALDEVSVEALNQALAPEQDVYQKLLELREREFAVALGSQDPGSSRANASGGPSRAQLDQLELAGSENRYETQSQARLDQDEGRETRQALSRLKELARRQADLNQRLRELQSELQAAATEAEREELLRRLKRLQEAQEEILRDTDELRQRMDDAQQGERLAEERERLDQTRENVRRASEALQEGELTQALTEGSRAGRQLSELEQDLRDASSGQFDDRLRELQREAGRIEEEQGRLAQDLREQNEASSRSLSASSESEREALQRGFERQEEDVERLLESMEKTVLEAEETEPLLAEELFEALNDAQRSRVEEALEMTSELLERGLPREAEEPEEIARKGLIGLRGSVESAAGSVLGTGVEALERASEELRRLTDELDSELAQAGGAPGQPGDGQPGAGQTDGPLRGGDFLEWSDRLRDVEEILDDPELSAEAARLRSRARTVREDYKRHAKEPDWDLVQVEIAGPLGELGRLVEQEVRRRKAEDTLVPIDRDPVPPEFEEAVRRYYERLGRSR